MLRPYAPLAFAAPCRAANDADLDPQPPTGGGARQPTGGGVLEASDVRGVSGEDLRELFREVSGVLVIPEAPVALSPEFVRGCSADALRDRLAALEPKHTLIAA